MIKKTFTFNSLEIELLLEGLSAIVDAYWIQKKHYPDIKKLTIKIQEG